MALYEELQAIDIIEPVMGLLKEGGYKLFPDGKIRNIIPVHMEVDSPWINVQQAADRQCGLWHRVYFNYYGLISRNCFNCFKFVVKPTNVKMLFKLYEFQKKHPEYDCKCGIERRQYAKHGGFYAGFFYVPLEYTMEERKAFAKKLDLKVKEAIGYDTPTYLKRACTEMENAAGPSNKWVYTENQHMYEDLLDSTWDIAVDVLPIPTVLQATILRRWIGWAIQHRDPAAEGLYESLQTMGVAKTVVYHDKDIELLSEPKTSEYRRKEREHVGSETTGIQRLPND